MSWLGTIGADTETIRRIHLRRAQATRVNGPKGSHRSQGSPCWRTASLPRETDEAEESGDLVDVPVRHVDGYGERDAWAGREAVGGQGDGTCARRRRGSSGRGRLGRLRALLAQGGQPRGDIGSKVEPGRLATRAAAVRAEAGFIREAEEEGTGLFDTVPGLAEPHVNLPDTLDPRGIENSQLFGDG